MKSYWKWGMCFFHFSIFILFFSTAQHFMKKMSGLYYTKKRSVQSCGDRCFIVSQFFVVWFSNESFLFCFALPTFCVSWFYNLFFCILFEEQRLKSTFFLPSLISSHLCPSWGNPISWAVWHCSLSWLRSASPIWVDSC